MLSENIKKLRTARGLSQEELAIKINVVRQTVSKWEKGLSVPDSQMLIKLAEELDTSVSVLLGESSEEEITELEAQMADPDLYSDAKRAAEVQKAYQQAQSDLARLYEEWENAEAALQEEA